ncbi:MAG TPA: GAP family protein [Streptosporangiaceae bacterium]|nr:GAP family protein [Streptosporangiaceae bacterium]
MNATFFALAFIAAANPKLLAIDLLLIENRRPRAMFTCLLGAGIATGVAIGLIVVFAIHPRNYHSEREASAGLDLALGLILLLIGGLVITGMLARIWARRAQSRGRSENKRRAGLDWAQRALSEPRLGVAFGIGFICGLPGAAYLAALHNLITGNWSTPTQVAGVFVFVIVAFILIIVPFLLLELWPSGTATLLRRTLSWATSHAMALIAWICLLLGVFLTISGVVRLMTA